MKKTTLLAISLLAIMGCRHGFDFDDTELVEANAQKIFGIVDSKQDWVCVQSGTVTITADADLDDIVKVQILTESPFLNEDARVLNEAKVKKGDEVTLVYDAPEISTKLIAACVSSKGVYYIQVFNIGQNRVNFSQTTRAARDITRASASEVPNFTTIKLRAPQKSFNAMRAEQGDACTIGGKSYSLWANSGWENELMWEPADGQTFNNGWRMDTEKNRGIIFREISDFTEGELENVQVITNDFLVKEGNDKYSVNKKRNNIRLIRKSKYFTINNNYIYTNGKEPLTLIPIQAYSTDFKMNHIFYYYYKPEEIPAGMNEVDYIKSLPKYKAIQVERVTTTNDAKAGKYFRNKEFLLPFYAEAPHEGEVQASAIFPAGYKVGFLNMKHTNGDYSIAKNNYGCTYGDGRLNYEVNHISGHFLTAMDKSLGGSTEEGMQFTDPRIAIFTANNKTYMCFEDGSDCNFCDMIIEVGSGLGDPVQETPEVETNAYTMCFEDRPNAADYDMNDVVLRCCRVDETTFTIALVAAGADDDLILHGISGVDRLNDKEVHEIFHATSLGSDGHRFVNTVVGGTKREVIADYVTVDKDMTIPNFLRRIYIENVTTGRTINFPQRLGESPYAIIVPEDFQYPKEKQSINTAYKGFLEWAQNINISGDWYKFNDATKIFPSLFKKWE
jgi:hypothetical protein